MTVTDIMATDMAPKNSHYSILALTITSALALSANAGEWQFQPALNIEQTYSNNVELTSGSGITSYVNQVHALINSDYKSRLLEFKFNSSSTYVSYSHNSNLNDDFRTLNTEGKLHLWTDGPALVVKGEIANRARNGANNGLADLVSGDTVETQRYSTGLEYQVNNRQFQLSASTQYVVNRTSDNIGENEGILANFQGEASQSNQFLWQLNGNYARRTNSQFSGKIYNIEAIVGTRTAWGFSPFIRVYDEDSTGNFGGQQNNGTASWGPGARIRLTKHFYIDLSYNYVQDKTVSDDYIAGTINWQPSIRTTLKAGYSKRFFGDAYQFEFNHKMRRLTNSISYNESIQVFDRNSYNQVNLGNFWCPVGADINLDASACFIAGDSNIDFDNYQLVSIFDQELVEGNEFSLNKTLRWNSTLNLARTSFSLSMGGNQRESLTSHRRDDNFDASFSVKRKISGRSDLTLSYRYTQRKFDNNHTQGSGQKDNYRISNLTYNKSLASSLETSFSLQYLDRNSSQSNRNYNETRVIVTLQKDF